MLFYANSGVSNFGQLVVFCCLQSHQNEVVRPDFACAYKPQDDAGCAVFGWFFIRCLSSHQYHAIAARQKMYLAACLG